MTIEIYVSGYHHHISERERELGQGQETGMKARALGLETRQTRLEPHGMFFLHVSLKFTNVYLRINYEYRTRGLETRLQRVSSPK
jgi:phenylpropionate dioxygenase-like ring-hydroxylating dioxygenase large terminal subunit